MADDTRKAKHQPMQPIYRDDDGQHRFRRNAVVRYLYDFAREEGLGLNELAKVPFSDDDWQQFYQLIGYSVDGYNEIFEHAPVKVGKRRVS